ncbi:MAG: winged helix-turn-helix domain-containing protein [Acidobacteriota bacterium]
MSGPLPRSPPPNPRERYRFGLYELDPGAAELRRDGRKVPLQDLPLRLLETLLERPGELVDRESLRDSLWPPDVHVDFDGSLNAAVRRLREALGDSAKDPRYLETVPRRGYRFIAPVHRIAKTSAQDPDRAAPQSAAAPSLETPSPEGPPPDTGAPPDSRPAGTRQATGATVAVVIAAVVLAAVGSALWLKGPGTSPSEPASTPPSAEAEAPTRVAVLPLEAIGDDARLGPIAAGLTDELVVQLAGLEPGRLHLVAPASVRRAHAENIDIQSIASRLDVGYVFAGALQLEDDRLRVAARLVRAEDETVMWTTGLDRRLDSLLDVQRALARRLGDALSRELLGGDPQTDPHDGEPQTSDATDPAAYEHFLRARHFLAQQTPSGFKSADDELRRALELEPEFTDGWAALATTRAMLGIYDLERPHDVFPRAELAVDRALELDPNHADALVARAMIDGAYFWRFEKAERTLRQVLAAAPQHLEALRLLGLVLQVRGRGEEARDVFRTARRFDPLSPALRSALGWSYFLAGRTDEAIGQAQAILELDANYLVAWDDLKWFLIILGRDAEAAEAFFRVVELEGEADAVPGLRRIFEAEGLDGLMRISLESQLESVARDPYHSPYDVMLPLATLGRTEEALDWLERSFDEREVDMLALASDPRIEALRGEPRYQALLDRFRAGP